MQRLKNEETENIERRPLRPRAVVLVPTRELAYQVLVSDYFAFLAD